MFIRPFEPYVWLGIGSMLIFIITVLTLLKKIFWSKQDSISVFVFSIILNLFEQGAGSRFSTLISKIQTLKFVFALNLLIGIVLTNAYKGIIISYLSAPFTKTLDVHYYLEQQNFKYISIMFRSEYHDWICTDLDYSINNTIEFFDEREGKVMLFRSICEPQYGNRCRPWPQEASQFGSKLKLIMDTTQNSVSHQDTSITKFKNRYTEILANIYAFPMCKMSEIIHHLTTGTKFAFASRTSEIDHFLGVFRQKETDITFFKGKDNFLSQPNHWRFSRIPHSQPYFRLVQLIASGIYDHWKYWLRERKGLKDSISDYLRGTEPVALSRKSNVFFVFYLLPFGYMISLIVLFTELLYLIIKRVIQPRWARKTKHTRKIEVVPFSATDFPVRLKLRVTAGTRMSMWTPNSEPVEDISIPGEPYHKRELGLLSPEITYKCH